MSSSPACKPDDKTVPAPLVGKDEMNLCELPIARLGSRDKRDTIEFAGEIVKDGVTIKQEWTVSGVANLGLPTEFAERVLVALVSMAAAQGFERKTIFTAYEVLKFMGVSDSGPHYKEVHLALKRLKGVMITTDSAWWDHNTKRHIKASDGFGLIDRFHFNVADDGETKTGGGYVIWNDWMLNSFQAGYLKTLDTQFYYALDGMLARRLYRFLDKRMHYQNRYELDIFALAARLGMVSSGYPSKVAQKLKPAFNELIARGFLSSAEAIKVGKFTRVKFTKLGAFHALQPSLWDDLPDAAPEDLPGDLPNLEPAQIDTEDGGGTLPPISAPMDVDPAQGTVTAFEGDCLSAEELAETWRIILHECEATMSYGTFRMIAGSALLDVEGEVVVIAVEGHSKDWVERQMRRKFLVQLSQCLGWRVQEISFVVVE